MDLVLENNNFRFDNKHFLQTEDTAIGSHLGMNYACTYTSRQNIIVSFGRGCEMLLSFCRKSVVSLMYVFKFRTFSDSSCSNNNFRFDNKHFLQTEDTAIGSHLGMNYACTYLGNWEQELY
jgi:hypothetical protein